METEFAGAFGYCSTQEVEFYLTENLWCSWIIVETIELKKGFKFFGGGHTKRQNFLQNPIKAIITSIFVSFPIFENNGRYISGPIIYKWGGN